MSNGSTEVRLCCCSGVDMDELPVLGCMGKRINSRLIDCQP